MSERLGHIMALVERYKTLSPDRLLLGGGLELSIQERRAVATQLSLRKGLESKLPTWSQAGAYVPSQLNLEQCSSEPTARLKAELFARPDSCVLDLTGGMGVDYWALSLCAGQGIYVEQSPELVEATEYNIGLLAPGGKHQFVCAEALERLERLYLSARPELIYLDPARREEQTASARRVYAIEDCTPSLSEVHRLIGELSRGYAHPPRLLVKLSPMLDIKHTLRLYPDIRAVYIMAVRGEVKELLLLFDYSAPEPLDLTEVEIHALDLTRQRLRSLSSTYAKEEALTPIYATAPQAYIYEPNAALMKSGLFSTLGERYGLSQLHPSSHLYTSEQQISSFPGRSFALLETHPASSSALRRLGKQLGKAEVSTRNYPLSSDALRQKLGVKSGGELTLMGTTLLDGTHTILVMRQLYD